MLDTLTKEEKVIIENPFRLFDISADGNKIAYTIKNKNSIEDGIIIVQLFIHPVLMNL